MSKERGNLVGGVSLAHPEEAKAVVAKGIKLIPSCGWRQQHWSAMTWIRV